MRVIVKKAKATDECNHANAHHYCGDCGKRTVNIFQHLAIQLRYLA